MNRMGKVSVVMCLLLGWQCQASAQQASGPPLAQEEAAELFRVDGWLCQPAIEIGIRDPGPAFAANAEAGRAVGNTRVWVFDDAETGSRVAVTAVKGMGATAEDFRKFASGLHKSTGRNASVEQEIIDTSSNPATSLFLARLENGASYTGRCTRVARDGAIPWTVCVAAVAPDHESLAEVRDSLAALKCGAGGA